MTAGYSGTPLATKLGIGEHTVVITIGAPKSYAAIVAPLPAGARISQRISRAPAFVHVFATARATLTAHIRKMRTVLTPNGVVWVSWPKKTSGVTTDITEDTIRAVALPLGFVDIKVCAVDDTWSGLKLVIRKELRALPRKPPERRAERPRN